MTKDIQNFTKDLIAQGNGPQAVAVELSDLYGLSEGEARDVYKRCKGIAGSLERHEEAVGRYKPEHAMTAYKLILLGRQFSDIAEHFKVDDYTLNTWRFEMPEFADAWGQALQRDFEVVETMLKLAIGYEAKDTKVFLHQGEEVIVPYMKQFPPNLKAVEMWLKTKYPAIWKDTQYIETNATHALTGLSESELSDKLKSYGVTAEPSALSALNLVEPE